MFEEGIIHGGAVSGTTSLITLFLLFLDAVSSVLARFQLGFLSQNLPQLRSLSCLISLPGYGSTQINGTTEL